MVKICQFFYFVINHCQAKGKKQFHHDLYFQDWKLAQAPENQAHWVYLTRKIFLCDLGFGHPLQTGTKILSRYEKIISLPKINTQIQNSVKDFIFLFLLEIFVPI
jgi:hypothetical protein